MKVHHNAGDGDGIFCRRGRSFAPFTAPVIEHRRIETAMANNPRYENGALRRKHRARLRAMGMPCHICGQPIHYDEPSDAKHPVSFVVDEIKPVSRWKEWGYDSARAAAEDWDNLAPAHYACNVAKSNKLLGEVRHNVNRRPMPGELDGKW